MSTAKADMKVELEWSKISQILQFAYPDITEVERGFLKKLTFAGAENASTIFELALCNCGNLHHEPTDGRDYTDGSDAKLVAVRLRGNGSTIYSARVDKENKEGHLRIGVYERVHDKMYYFLVPPEAHFYHKSLEIKFDSETCLPKKTSKGVNWWDYEVDTIYDVSVPVNSLQSSSHTEIAVPVLTRFTVRAKKEKILKREEQLDKFFDWR